MVVLGTLGEVVELLVPLPDMPELLEVPEPEVPGLLEVPGLDIPDVVPELLDGLTVPLAVPEVDPAPVDPVGDLVDIVSHAARAKTHAKGMIHLVIKNSFKKMKGAARYVTRAETLQACAVSRSRLQREVRKVFTLMNRALIFINRCRD